MTGPPLDLRGIFPALTTPFTPRERVDLHGIEANIQKYNALGLAGYVVCGSTGESVHLRAKETLAVLDAVRSAAAPERILIAGTGCETTRETIELTGRAAALGYHAALMRTPAYYKPMMTPSALERHFRAVADGSPIPILIYSVPQFTGLVVDAPLVARLATHPNIIGLKESSGDLQHLGVVLKSVPRSFAVFCGAATALQDSLALGSRGGILAAACVIPEMCLEVYEAFAAGDQGRARAAQQRLTEPALAVTRRFGISGLKFAMGLRGYVGGAPRPPLEPLSEEGCSELRRIFGALPAPH